MKRMSKKLWVGFYVGSLSLFLLGLMPVITGVLLLGNKFSPNTAGPLALLALLGFFQFIVVKVIYTFLILSKMWGAIQDGQTEMTVGKVIGFLFIPFFGIYWLFRAWGSYPTEYNNFIDRQGLNLPYLSTNVYIYYPIITVLGGIFQGPVLLMPFFFIPVISRTCEAVNDLCDAFEQRQKNLPPIAAPSQFEQISVPKQFPVNA